MIKPASLGAAIVLGGSALALTAGLIPAQAATSGWRTDITVTVRGSVTLFTSVAATSPADAWASGFSLKAKGTAAPESVIRQWTGKTWRSVTLPAKTAKAWADQGPILTEVGAASVRKVWVFNSLQGTYLRLNGRRWSLGQLPGASATSDTLIQIDAVKAFTGTNVWAFGEQDSISGTTEVSAPYAAHYNGSRWSKVTVPALSSGGGAITAVAAVSSNNIWAVEGASASSSLPLAANPAVVRAVAASPTAKSAAARLRAAGSVAAAPVVLHWTSGTGWQQLAQQPDLAAGDQLVSAVTEPGGHVWFGGSADNSAKGTSPLAAEWNGTSWSVADLPGKASSAQFQLATMTPDGTGGIWAAAVDSSSGTERIWHLHGSTWSQAKPSFGKHPWVLVALAQAPRSQSVWGVGAVEGSSKSSANGLIGIEGTLPR